MPDTSNREPADVAAAPYYEPTVLAEQILAALADIEQKASGCPQHRGHRSRHGLICAPEARAIKGSGRVEDAITGWIAEYFPHAKTQVRGFAPGFVPDIVFLYERDAHGPGVQVVLEAKPVWQRWITTGERDYAGATVDEVGRSTGNYFRNNVRQVRSDRDKLLRTYAQPHHRLMLLALVFQRPSEIDRRVIEEVGPGWEVQTRHIVDLCNPPGDDIGVTGMVFWPSEANPQAKK